MTIETLAPKRNDRRPRVPDAAPAATPPASPADRPEANAAVIDPQVLERAARVIRVLGHPLRLRLLEALEGGERNVTELVETSGASQALVSQHLAILRAESVVGFRRDGARIFYQVTEPKVRRILDCIRDCDLPELDAAMAGALVDQAGDA